MKTLLNLFAICMCYILQAHTIWIETNTFAKTNQKHEIKIFFGELDSPTPTAKWFSDIKDLEIKIISPSGNEFSIKEKVQNEKYYSSFFTPTEYGTYIINVKHLVKDTFKKMKITYQTVAFVKTNQNEQEVKLGSNPFAYEVSNTKFNLNKEKSIRLFFEGEAKSKQKLKIVADNNWEQSLYSNVHGKVTFKPLWKGKYLLEMVNSQKKQGEHNGQPYEIDYEMITYLVEVK